MTTTETALLVIAGIVRWALGISVLFLLAVLDTSVAARLALIAFWAWVLLTVNLHYRVLSAFAKEFEKHLHWTRLIFITLHIRNEQDQLLPAYDRLKDDEETADRRDDFARRAGRIDPAFAVMLWIIQAALVFGFFGLLALTLKNPEPVREWLLSLLALVNWPTRT